MERQRSDVPSGYLRGLGIRAHCVPCAQPANLPGARGYGSHAVSTYYPRRGENDDDAEQFPLEERYPERDEAVVASYDQWAKNNNVATIRLN